MSQYQRVLHLAMTTTYITVEVSPEISAGTVSMRPNLFAMEAVMKEEDIWQMAL